MYCFVDLHVCDVVGNVFYCILCCINVNSWHLQKLKPIEDIRKKRKRYRANKKRIFSSWKKRKEDYELRAQYEIIEETVAKKQREQEALLRSQRQQDTDQKQQEHNEQIEKEFEV